MTADTPDERAEHTMAGPLLTIRIEEQLRRLHEEPTWGTATRNAITLVKDGVLRVVLIALHAGASLSEHHAPGPITVQVVAGRVRFRAAGRDHELGPGQLVALQATLPHEVEAHEDSALLLTLIDAPPAVSPA
jgi:quercetin dioxygenase-like cupin family protein